MWTRALVSILLVAQGLAKGGYGRGGGGGHHYPHSTGLSGASAAGNRHSYPHSTGWSGHGTNSYASYRQKTVVHNHYYSPPRQMHYSGYSSHSLPVYHGQPPVYVYQYRDSGSRFNTLLAGLALYNLGRMSSSGHHYDGYNRGYRSSPGEHCRLGIRRDNGDYEETRVDCQIMTSFIIDAETQPEQTVHTIQTHQQVTSITTNGTTVSQTTVVDALESKGPPIHVTPKTQCYLIRVSSVTNMKKTVPCGLLQKYAESSFRNKAQRLMPVIAVLVAVVLVIL